MQDSNMNIRIANIGARPPAYLGRIPDNLDCIVSIVKYLPNNFYGKMDEYLEKGYTDEGYYLRNERTLCSIDKNYFKNQEIHYVIADVIYDPKNLHCNLNSVGDRLLELSVKERSDFFKVYAIVDRELREKHIDKE